MQGRYLSSGSCNLCSSAITGCERCRSSTFCTRAQAGYFLQRRFGFSNGRVSQCKSTCATCVSFPACRTCITNYVKFGSQCIYFRYVFSIVLFQGLGNWFNTANTNAQNEAGAFINVNLILFAFIFAAGSTNFDQAVATFMRTGSIEIGVNVAAQPNEDFATMSSTLIGNIQNNNLQGLNVLSSTNTVNNADTSTDDGVNLGLILGISIPIFILRTCWSI